jgi:RND family efflux transporter MFP subunit
MQNELEMAVEQAPRPKVFDHSGRRRRASPLVLLAALLTTWACERPAPPAPPPPKVEVARPVEREVVEWDEYTARLEAVDLVEVRARVGGYLDEIRFHEGAIVQAGDVLFVIDPRPYQATLKRAEADVSLAKARLDLARKRFERSANLVRARAMSQEEADTRAAEAQQGEAALEAAVAAVEAAHLDVEFTQVKAPVAGRVGRWQITEGNLVNGGEGAVGTVLTTIVSLDPIHAYFEADERQYLKYARLAQRGERPSSRDFHNPVRVALADEQTFDHEGWMDFVDNRLDPNTGTIVGRALLPNHDLLLSPGMFVRLRLPGSALYRAVLVPDEAVGIDQSERFVWVIDEREHAQRRKVRTGPLHDGLRIIREGVAPDDRIVVAGAQRLRSDVQVAAVERPLDSRLAGRAPTSTPPSRGEGG